MEFKVFSSDISKLSDLLDLKLNVIKEEDDIILSILWPLQSILGNPYHKPILNWNFRSIRNLFTISYIGSKLTSIRRSNGLWTSILRIYKI